MKKNASKRLLAIALAVMMLMSLMPAAFASDVEDTVPTPEVTEPTPTPVVEEPVPTPEVAEPTPTPAAEEPTPTPVADPTPAPTPEVAAEPAETPAPEPTPAAEPCTLTEGCTLNAGHEGECVIADADPEDEPDEVDEAIAAFLEAINAIEIPEDLSTLTPEGIEELRAQIAAVLSSMPMLLSESETTTGADDPFAKVKAAIEALEGTAAEIENFLQTHIVYNVNLNKWYEALDAAVTEAEDNNTLVLLADCKTNGFNLDKNLNIVGKVLDKPITITFENYGIALWYKALTFTNCNIVMTRIGSTPYTGWDWMSICAKAGSLTLNNSTMTMDGTGTPAEGLFKTHAIYFDNGGALNLNGSSVTISNYGQDALEWDGNGTYAFNLSKSSFTATNNRSGLAGTFTVTCDASTMNVNNNRGNGSNGSHFDIKNNSTVNFNDNGSHGISAGNCTITDSIVNTTNNGANGLHVGQTLTVSNSVVTITGNKCSLSSDWTIPGALYLGGNANVDATSTLTITGNSGSGIYQKAGTLTIDPSAAVTIMTNTAEKLGLGGGVYINGTATFPAGVKLYNNHASTAGDDIYSPGSITFGATGADWKLDGAPDCNGAIHNIDGWYDDSDGSRWLADTDDTTKLHIKEYAAGTYIGVALKAAHGIIPVTVTVNKVWDDNNNSASTRPDSVTIKLYADGVDTKKSIVLNEANQWCGSFTGLAAKTEAGTPVVYSVKEDTVAYYKAEITSAEENTFTVTNTYATKSIQVNKVWNDNNNSNSKRPNSVLIYLYADGTKISEQYIKAANNWVGTFDNLPVYNANGVETEYTISERNVYYYRNNITESNGVFTVTNTYSPTSYSGKGIPSTGDDSNLAMWGVVMAVSLAAGAAVVLITVKKRKNDSK